MDRKISIIIPTYYRNESLEDCIESALQQTCDDTEVIVVDDSGEGFARPVAEKYPSINYIEKDKNEGAQSARKFGLKSATGDFIQFLDDDDRIKKNKINKQIQILENNDDVGVVYCGIEHESNVIEMPGAWKKGDVLSYALSFELSPCTTSTMLIDREVLEEIQPLNDYQGATDNVMKIRLSLITNFDFVNEPLVVRRRPEDSLGKSFKAVKGRKQILDDFSHVYDEMPKDTRKSAMKNIYGLEGMAYQSGSFWSPRAIVAFTKAIYYSPERHLDSVAPLLASVFGRPGWKLGEKLFEYYRKYC